MLLLTSPLNTLKVDMYIIFLLFSFDRFLCIVNHIGFHLMQLYFL